MVKAKLKATWLHFLFTCFIALISAAVIFLLWYPSPYTAISGGIGLWKILILVELSLGPLMSLVIFNPSKSVRQLMADYSMVAVVQFGALAYGIHTLYLVRPVFMVFVKDRFELVTASDLGGSMSEAKIWRKGLSGPTLIGVRSSENAEEQQELMFDTVSSGKDVQLRPKYYAELNSAELEKATKPVSQLVTQLNAPRFSDIRAELRQMESSYRWVPVVNGLNYWLAVLDDNLVVVKFYSVDPWELKNPSSVNPQS